MYVDTCSMKCPCVSRYGLGVLVSDAMVMVEVVVIDC